MDTAQARSRKGQVRRLPGERGGKSVSDEIFTARAEAPRIDTARLADWMDSEALPGKGEPLTTRFMSGGTQNVIYELRRGEEQCVLRMPPDGAPPDRDKGILREWRIIEALDGTEVPHTKAVGVCPDASILGRPFYLMGFVDGWSPMDTHGKWPEPFDSDLSIRPGLSYQLAEGIALLSKVDWQAKGLQDLGRPDGFHAHQETRAARSRRGHQLAANPQATRLRSRPHAR
jgi:aminoglycoside phosphotransferase (APT) family kinase protein